MKPTEAEEAAAGVRQSPPTKIGGPIAPIFVGGDGVPDDESHNHWTRPDRGPGGTGPDDEVALDAEAAADPVAQVAVLARCLRLLGRRELELLQEVIECPGDGS